MPVRTRLRERGHTPGIDFEAFTAGFRRSKRGNLWRAWRGLTLSVFKTGRGFNWCIANGDGPLFGGSYGTADEALAWLWEELLVRP
jgi:hypothetical protein